MGSSKWIQVESPSPFRFLAALMPPCAQTECERFTGTIENRSTSPPISAILITADRPASPPPITIIFGFVAISTAVPIRRGVALAFRPCRKSLLFDFDKNCLVLRWRVQKRIHRDRAHQHKTQTNHSAHIAKPAPGAIAGSD